MRLAAIFLRDNLFFDSEKMLNFGGKFLYNYNEKGKRISKTLNENFIESFYGKKNLSLVSAIVGRNGTGKTSLLREIANHTNDLNVRTLGYYSILIFEHRDDVYIHRTYKKLNIEFEYKEFSSSFGSIYYSPFLDFNDEISGIDLSFDAITERDIEIVDSIDIANSQASAFRKLRINNTERQLEFVNSKYKELISKDFDLPIFESNKVSFSRHRIKFDYDKKEISFHNTPDDFREPLQFIYESLDKEATAINEDRHKGYSLFNLQKNLFKNYIVMDVVCLLIKQMERSNDFLREGHLRKEFEYGNNLTDTRAKEVFYSFLDFHYYSITLKDGGNQLLPVKETKDLIESLHGIIDNIEERKGGINNLFDWSSKYILLDYDQTRRILKIQNDFLIKVDKYYGYIDSDKEEIFARSGRINGILNFEPANRRLSSGENALLNFFSRLYSYFKKNIIDIRSAKKYKNYLLLIDEGDLGFHPKWKTKFINSVTKFLALFFESFDSNVQIIFTTHDPLTLSDILNYNIIYLDKDSDGNMFILEGDERPRLSFGANVHELLASSFFLEDELFGEFASNKIKEIIDWINYNREKKKRKEDFKIKFQLYSKIISQIDEKVISLKLSEMMGELISDSSLRLRQINEEMKKLQKEKDRLNKDFM
jgi:hypothetical protein